jgi:uncharacterized repeat protein (TIGR01451 family)/fimbrial isopeptide formation D2 family protein
MSASSKQNVKRKLALAVMSTLAMWVLAAAPAWAEKCSDYVDGIIDGNAVPAPGQLTVDRDCYISNYDPLDTNITFIHNLGSFLVVFDNVRFRGNMSCDDVGDIHKVWFSDSSSYPGRLPKCYRLWEPVDAVVKENPPGQTFVVIGVPFTYTLTMPVMPDGGPDVQDLYDLRIVDDLTAGGADLRLVGFTSSIPGLVNTGTDTNLVLEHPRVPAGAQLVVELTVVAGDTPRNAPGTTFTNFADWTFYKDLRSDGSPVFLPGDSSETPPLTIAGPELTLTKTGPATLNLGTSGEFTLDIQNVGNSDAWQVNVVDLLPDGASGGMCASSPTVTSARVFGPNGNSRVQGKGWLVEGVDYFVSFTGSPRCQFTFETLSPAGVIAPDERLIITYEAELDPDTQDGAVLTNVAGTPSWYDSDGSVSDRHLYTGSLTNGTVGVLDSEDAHTLTAELSGIFFEKTVANLSTGANPTATAAPGDRLRYTLRVQTTDSALNAFSIGDDLGALNANAVFEPGSLALVASSIPAGASTTNTNPNGGTNGTGLVDVRSLSLAAGSELTIQYDVTLADALLDGSVVSNQAILSGGSLQVDSDDPNVNGQSDPDVSGDEDPTRVLIEVAPPAALVKSTTQPTVSIGETFTYRITVPSAPHGTPLFDVRITDNLAAVAADVDYVDVSRVSGPGSWTPVNTGSGNTLVIEDTGAGIDIPAGEQVVIDITLRLTDSATNVAGLTFGNTAAYTYNQLNGDASSELDGLSGTSADMTIVEPQLTVTKTGPGLMRVGPPATFTLDVQNTGGGRAHSVELTDALPNTAEGGMCDAAPAAFTAQIFQADGATPVGPALAQGADFSVSFSGAPACTFNVDLLSAAATIGPGERLIMTYQALLDADSLDDITLTNVAGATAWFSAAASQARGYAPELTDGSAGILDHEDEHTILTFSPLLSFEKTVINVTTGESPAMTASPGDRLSYSLRVINLGPEPLDDFSVVDELDRLNRNPAFQPGTLQLTVVPDGATTGGTSASGGAAGTGYLEVSGLSLAGSGGTIDIGFEVELAPVLANASLVRNQSQIIAQGFVVQDSDDPNKNDVADPVIVGDEDPTEVQVESAPAFDVDKTSTYLDGDPNVLMAGETLRYTITVQNVGDDNATNAVLRDQIPANTAYVAGSTTLNGASVADVGGTTPLAAGMTISSPADSAAGAMTAIASGSRSNVAVIEFDVVVDASAVDGTVLTNQAFLTATAGIIDQPSDDPDTPVADDPTRDVVGNLPLIYAEKSATLQTDGGSRGVIDPGDVLRYTISIYNNGSADATDATLTDAVPVNTTYVANTVTLNGQPVGRPDGGSFPLAGGLPVSSADVNPPVPGPGAGTITAGEVAVVQFDLRVDDDLPTGTLISNQAVVSTAEVVDQLTDGDGDPATGPEPTVVVVGPAQQLSITKQAAVVGGGAALAGSTLEYLVRVRNVGPVPAIGVSLVDDLDYPTANQLQMVPGSATVNGQSVAATGSVLDIAFGDLDVDGTITLRFQATLSAGLDAGTRVTNRAVATWNVNQQVEASVAVDVGGIVGVGVLNGSVWHDASYDEQLDSNERVLAGWTVELMRNGQVVHTTQTGTDGTYRITGLGPNAASGDSLSLTFTAPGAGPGTALLGQASSASFTNGLQRIDDIVVQSGNNLMNLDLPIDPNGVVYDSVSRTPVSGATLTLVDDVTRAPLPATCFDDTAQQNQVTRADGYYKFDLNFSDGACGSGASYTIEVAAPGSAYTTGYSVLIPPTDLNAPTPFSVPGCPGSLDDAVPATGEHCEAGPSEFAPPTSVQAQSSGTAYRVTGLVFDTRRLPGSAQIFNNHIPLDPILDGAVAISKTTPMVNVNRGQLVPYTITVTNTFGVSLQDVAVIDRFPPGFRYVEGSARLDGVPVEPAMGERDLAWGGLTLAPDSQRSIKMLLGVSAGVSEGEFVNRAQAINTVGQINLSGEATATVRVVPDPTFDCTDVTGKVYDDGNRNGRQDLDEFGLQGVRLLTPQGLVATTDEHGRFHITCATVPRDDRGSNFALKLDDRTLPSGFRASTDRVQIKRATRGKALHFEFGASIHRVVGLEIADGVFFPESSEIRPQWKHRFELLLEELTKSPSVLRLTYLADVEDPKLVKQRLRVVKKQIVRSWRELDCCYRLELEDDVFWRLGAPAGKAVNRRVDGGDE